MFNWLKNKKRKMPMPPTNEELDSLEDSLNKIQNLVNIIIIKVDKNGSDLFSWQMTEVVDLIDRVPKIFGGETIE